MTGVQTCALPISASKETERRDGEGAGTSATDDGDGGRWPRELRGGAGTDVHYVPPELEEEVE